MKDKIIFGVLGLILGILLAVVFTPTNSSQVRELTHQMPDGTVMRNSGDMSSMMMEMSAGLRGKTGDEFDKEFLAEMIVHHQGAVDMAKQVLATSKRPELLKLADDIITAQTGEIQMMKNWQKEWFKI
jgi:uncharacterized protein (DUF305 family)